jgi:hypothetical protein
MNLTISLDEPLAAQLQQEASARRLSLEQVVCDLLGSALGQIAHEQTWHKANQRRAELIRKSRALGLSRAEGQELDQLQADVDQRLEQMDRHLLEAAEQFRQLAERLPDDTKP